VTGRLARWGYLWVSLAALWLWLDDTVATPELVTGAVCAALAATVADFVLAKAAPSVRFRLRWLRLVWRLPLSVVVDLGRLLRVLVLTLLGRRKPGGRFHAYRFDAGSANNPDDVGRRALAKLAGSFSPNTVVVGIDAKRDLILVHQLEPDDSAHSADPLELG
jgi:multisubunit Na+/H+ antiporter MnhE subunit